MPANKQGFVHLYLLIGVLIISGVLISSVIPISRSYSSGKGQVEGISYAKDGNDDNSGSGSSRDSGSSNSGSSNSSSGSSDKSSGSTQVSSSIKLESTKEETVPSKIQNSISASRIKTEIKQGDLEVKFEAKNGEVDIKTKIKSGENETELSSNAENEALREVSNELEKEDVAIATGSGQVAIINKLSGAIVHFPLSVNPTTRELTVTTPAGSKVVATLPQEAIDNMRAAHVIDDVISDKSEKAFGSVQDLITLDEQNGVLGYEIVGTKNHKLLWAVPVKTNVTAFVSAENGQVVSSTESLFGRILAKLQM